MRDTLHWLPVPQRNSYTYRIAAMFWCCLVGVVASYLRELCYFFCRLWWAVATLRSSSGVEILDPRVNASTIQRRIFSVVAPFIWNSLSLEKRVAPKSKTPLFNLLNGHGLLGGLRICLLKRRYINSLNKSTNAVVLQGLGRPFAELRWLAPWRLPSITKNAVQRRCCIQQTLSHLRLSTLEESLKLKRSFMRFFLMQICLPQFKCQVSIL